VRCPHVNFSACLFGEAGIIGGGEGSDPEYDEGNKDGAGDHMRYLDRGQQGRAGRNKQQSCLAVDVSRDSTAYPRVSAPLASIGSLFFNVFQCFSGECSPVNSGAVLGAFLVKRMTLPDCLAPRLGLAG